MREAEDRDALLLALVENVAREDLSPVEEARAYASLMDEFELSLGDVAERVGRSKPSVSNRLRLLELPDDVLALVERGQLSEGHARAVLSVPDHDDRRQLARRIVRQGLSVRAAERAARWAGAQDAAAARARRVGRSGARRAARTALVAADRRAACGSQRGQLEIALRRRDGARRDRRRRSSGVARHAADDRLLQGKRL